MPKPLWSIALLAALILTPLAPLPATAQPPMPWLPDELLVGFRPGVPDADAEAVYRGHGAARLETLRGLRVHRVRVPPSALEAIERALARRPEVQFVERNHVLLPELIANDPSYPKQWHLPKIFAPAAWDFSVGRPEVVIAILDTGVDPTHPDLAAKLLPGYNTYDKNTSTADVEGHGTKVAGSAAAIANNATGVASVAWDNRILPVRVTDSVGYAYISTIANGLTWAVDHGAKVMNVSFSIRGSSTVSSAAQYVRSKGGLVVASGGNCGCVESAPNDPNIIFVAATDQNDNKASFSSQGNHLDLAAPGVSITTTTRGGGYGSVSGTSFASPITAGVVALMMSVNSTLSPADLEALLKANADDKGTAGWDSSFGFGRLNAYRAVAAAAASVPAPDTTPPAVSVASPTEGSKVSSTVTVTISASDDSQVGRVDLYIDGSLYASTTTSPYSFSWDTKAWPNGRRTLTARAVDTAGNVATSADVSIDVDNATDTTPPSVSITSTSLSKNKLTVTASASDNIGVVRMELYLDGKLSTTDSSSPWSFSINTPSLKSGTHTLEAKAYDAAGNAAVSAPVTFTK